MKVKKAKSDKSLKLDKNFAPSSVDKGDEIFRNGIFHFNITKMLAFIYSHLNEFIPEPIPVKDFMKSSSISEVDLESIHSNEPVILAEISPGRYSIIDGNHRMEKARRSGIEHIMAYRLNMNQHIQFLTTQEGYVAYVEYWNGRMKDLRED